MAGPAARRSQSCGDLGLRHFRQTTAADIYVHVIESVRKGTPVKMDDGAIRV